jgi:hypothetical protein
MSKRATHILIATIALLLINLANSFSIDLKPKGSDQDKHYSSVNDPASDYHVIIATEDDLNEDKFKTSLHYPCSQHSSSKILSQNYTLASTRSAFDNQFIYNGIPVYIAVNNFRL